MNDLDMTTAQEHEAVTTSNNLTEPAYYTCANVATLLEISPKTLRNYVWLQRLGKSERKRRALQSPPKGMPRPKTVRGHLIWPAEQVREFAKKFLAAKAIEKAPLR